MVFRQFQVFLALFFFFFFFLLENRPSLTPPPPPYWNFPIFFFFFLNLPLVSHFTTIPGGGGVVKTRYNAKLSSAE